MFCSGASKNNDFIRWMDTGAELSTMAASESFSEATSSPSAAIYLCPLLALDLGLLRHSPRQVVRDNDILGIDNSNLDTPWPDMGFEHVLDRIVDRLLPLAIIDCDGACMVTVLI